MEGVKSSHSVGRRGGEGRDCGGGGLEGGREEKECAVVKGDGMHGWIRGDVKQRMVWDWLLETAQGEKRGAARDRGSPYVNAWTWHGK